MTDRGLNRHDIVDSDANNLKDDNDLYSTLVPACSEMQDCHINDETDAGCSNHKTHRHSSKCFTTEVFLYGIKFILKRGVHSASPNVLSVLRIESISSTDDGFADDSSSLQWSVGSDRCATTTSVASDGFHEAEKPIKPDSNIDKVLLRLSSSMRSSVCEGCPSLPKLSKSFYDSLENILIYFRDKYHSCQWLGSSAAQLSDTELSDARRELRNVYESMFSERINWGRIVAMVGFVGELSVCALSADRLELIEEYVSESVYYVQEHIMSWITAHGGWEGLVDFQTGHNDDGADLDNMFGGLSRLAGVAALALAGVVICKFVADHI